MKRIGIFGGTFDPVHMGHLLLAETARVQAGLSRVLFMPAHIQPFKQDTPVSSDDDRLRMLALATAENPAFGVTTIEIEKGGVSYTIDSLRALREEHSGARLSFIIGTDMFLMLDKWKDAEQLAREFDFVVGARPGYQQEKVAEQVRALHAAYGTNTCLVDNPQLLLSSTEIRKRVRTGDTIRYRVPERVRMYLLVREREGARRFAHTKRVMDLSVQMAKRFGEDPQKAELAALLHDYHKNSADGVSNDLGHGALGAEAARQEFGVTDEAVLNAICYHTTGRAGMSRLEKIVFTADKVEPGRTYDSCERLREACLRDLETGTLMVLSELKEILLRDGLVVSENTEAAIAELKKEHIVE